MGLVVGMEAEKVAEKVVGKVVVKAVEKVVEQVVVKVADSPVLVGQPRLRVLLLPAPLRALAVEELAWVAARVAQVAAMEAVMAASMGGGMGGSHLAAGADAEEGMK
mmetsp:Transcript_81878/g.128964  ORF Transcript_81878/g.128964 Transcript_81878/m.128964 type:complete len:107 (-) Transcript_81878:968-1288(-)